MSRFHFEMYNQCYNWIVRCTAPIDAIFACDDFNCLLSWLYGHSSSPMAALPQDIAPLRGTDTTLKWLAFKSLKHLYRPEHAYSQRDCTTKPSMRKLHQGIFWTWASSSIYSHSPTAKSTLFPEAHVALMAIISQTAHSKAAPIFSFAAQLHSIDCNCLYIDSPIGSPIGSTNSGKLALA